MHISTHIHIGIIHSLIGKNDGVSIVIDQSVNAMVRYMGVDLGNVYFLAAHISPRFNTQTCDALWHRNEVHKTILKEFSRKPSAILDSMIHENALLAKAAIKKFVDNNGIDLIIAHNTSHVYNFITAVGLGYYLEELRQQDIIWPNVIVWWHDSFFERKEFLCPNPIIKKYLKYLPGTNIDGIVTINQEQENIAKKHYGTLNIEHYDSFFRDRIVTIPNTSDVAIKPDNPAWEKEQIVFPLQDNYNQSFFADIGLLRILKSKGKKLDETVFLLQHTRIIPRKKIENAIDLAFGLYKTFKENDHEKCIALIVSGHSGDEQNDYKAFLNRYFKKMSGHNRRASVILIFGEDCILSNRDVIVDKKFYMFAEIPSIIAAHGGIGTYFSEIEGFGNNLLEMAAAGLPVVINRYAIYKSDIEPLGFHFPGTDYKGVTPELLKSAYRLLTDLSYRNSLVKNNLQVINRKLNHKIIADKLNPLIDNCFKKILR